MEYGKAPSCCILVNVLRTQEVFSQLKINFRLWPYPPQIIKEGKAQDDLNELAKLFDIHKS